MRAPLPFGIVTLRHLVVVVTGTLVPPVGTRVLPLPVVVIIVDRLVRPSMRSPSSLMWYRSGPGHSRHLHLLASVAAVVIDRSCCPTSSCRRGTGHLRHVVVVVAPSLSSLLLLSSPSCLVAIVPPWHWPPPWLRCQQR